MREKLAALLVAGLLSSAMVLPAHAAGREPPTVKSCKIETALRPVRPGDTVTVTIVATREGGLKGLRGFLNRSQYLRGDGKGEVMISLLFKPTENANEFRAQFVVPSLDERDNKTVLPEGPYRLSLTGGTDGEGGNYSTRYIPVGSLGFDPAVKDLWQARLEGQRFVHDGKPPALTLKVNCRADIPAITYRMEAQDHFGVPVGKPTTGTFAMKAGESTRIALAIPRKEGTTQYRVRVDVSGGTERTLRRRLIADITTGPRRMLYLDDSDWEHLPANTLADSPPDGKWQKGRQFGLSRATMFSEPFKKLFGPETKAVWIRTSFQAPDWLVGKHYELYFGEAATLCDVFVNGRHVGTHGGAYYPSSFDVTKALLPGKANRIEVRVQDTSVAVSGKVDGEAFVDPVLRAVAPHAPASANRQAGRLLWPMQGYPAAPLGVVGTVRVLALADVRIDDVFVIPSVQENKLTCRVRISNATAAPRSVVVSNGVFDGEMSALTFKPKRVALKANETVTVDIEQPWVDPKLWWPHDPHLYRLTTTLANNKDAIVDRCSTRFGFREIRIDGRDFRFNGKRFKTRMQAMIPNTRGTHEDAFEIFSNRVAALKKRNQYGPQITRIHTAMASTDILDVADEMGMLLEVDGPLGSVRSDWTSQQMWDNYRGMVTAWIERDRNHPSMLFWAMENEILVCTNTQPTFYDSNRKNLVALGEHAQRLDPTRPVLFEGDADIDGTWNTMTLHYPRFWYVHPDLPNSAFWLKYGQSDMALDMCYPHSLTWNTPKPIFLGEDGLYIEAYPPHDLSSLGGDEVYETIDKGNSAWAHGGVDDRGHAMFVEGYRDAEIAVTSTTLGGTGGPACDLAHLPVRSFVRERSSRFYSGKTIDRHINLHHDLLVDADVTFEWALTQGDEVLQEGKETFAMAAGDLKRFVVRLQMPTVEKPTPLVFTTSVSRLGKEVFAETHDYTVYPPCELTITENVRLGIFDRHQKTSRLFNKHGAAFVEFGTVEPGTMEDMKALNCLLIGEGGLDRSRLPRLRPGLASYMTDGGVIICLRQEWGLDWLPAKKPLRMDVRRNTTISWRRSPGHPVLDGITDDMLRYWYGDNIVSSADFLKEPRVGWHPIVDSGGLQGLRWASIVEIPVGRGAMVFCQMNLVDKLEHEPAALRLMTNLLSYAATRKPVEPVAIRTVTAKDSPMAKRLEALGVEASDEADAQVVVVDADVDTDEQLTADLAQQLDQGRTVLLHGLTPENLGAWQGLLPTEVELKKVDRQHAVRVAQDPLLAGISATDLWWGQYGIWSFAPEGAVQIAYAATVKGESTELVGEGGLIAIPVGKGRLLIDQLLWEKPDVHQERSGQYISLLLHNLTYGG